MSSLPIDDLQYISKHLRNIFSALKNKTILITGGTGFFGKWLVETLSYLNQAEKLNLKVILITRNVLKAESQYSHLDVKIVYLQCDLSNSNDQIVYEDPIDFVIHAGNEANWPKNPEEELSLYNCIVDGTKKLLEFSTRRKVDRFLYVSSGAAAEPADIKNSSTRVYSESKRMAEILTQIFAAQNHFVAPIARCYSFVGPHLPLDKHYAIGNFLNCAFQKKKIEIHSDGSSIRSYLYAADLTIWLLTILIKGKNETIYQVGSEESISVKDLAEKISRFFPESEVVIKNNTSKKTIYLPKIGQTQDELSLPKAIPLDKALSKSIDWLKSKNS